MPARIDDVCDAVVAALRSANPGLSVVPCDEEDIGDLSRAGPSERTVYVLPAGYGQAETVTRGVDANDYRVSVVVFDHTDPAPDLKPWRRELVAFVEQQIYAPLSNARADGDGPIGGGFVPQAAEVVEVYDPNELLAGRFYSEIQFTFREYAAA